MSVCSIEFLTILIGLSGVFFLIPGLRQRQTTLSLCNAAFLSSQVPDAAGWIALGLFLATGYVTTRLLIAYPRKALLASYLGLLLATFLIVKKYDFVATLLPQSIFGHGIVIIGLSYMLFRQIHVVVDAYQGQIERFSLWTYVNYQLNLFGILAGPIQRYQDFQQCWDCLEPLATDRSDVCFGYARVFWGVLKIVVAATACQAIYDRMINGLVDGATPSYRTTLMFLTMFYVYPFYLYFNFSGYCDITIGGGYLLGMRMPENFDHPFFSRNLIDYWTRFHRTLGAWIRDYVFMPLYKLCTESFPRRDVIIALTCLFAANFMAGLWHGSTWNFVIFGAIHGLGVAAVKLWEFILVRYFGRKGLKSYLQSKWIRAISIVLTFHYVCFASLFFPKDLHTLAAIVKSLTGMF